MRALARIALAALCALLPGRIALAKGTKPAPPPPGAPSAASPKTLPPGCERLTDGRNYALSLDGARLAFARWVPDRSNLDYHAEPIPKSSVFVRTLATKSDAKVPNAAGVPVGWTTAGGLCLSSGTVVDPATGKTVPGTAVMPKGANAEAIAWTRDGSRLAYAADWTANVLSPPPGVPQVLAEVDAAGKTRLFDFEDKVYTGEGGTLAWSADGKRLAFNIPFFHYGHVPPRRTGFVNAGAEPGIVNVDEISQDNGIPGMHEARRPMRPHPGTTGPVLGASVWNAAGTQLAFVTGGGGGNADLYLFDVEAQERRRQTTDGGTKWSPAIDAAGRRVAFLTGTVADWSVRSPSQMTLNPQNLRIADAKLRVVDVASGDAKDYPVPGAPAYPGNVTWSPDGTRVLYEIHGGNAEGTYAQAVPAATSAPSAPAGGATPPRDVVVGAEEEVVAALRSGDSKRITVACEQKDIEISAGILVAIHEVMPKWIADEDYRPACAMLEWIGRCKTTDALQDVRAALRSKNGMTVRTALRTVLALDAKDAMPDVDAVRTKFAEAPVRAHAAGTMVRLGDERGWADLEAATKHKDPDTRDSACRELAAIGTVKAVELLLSLVGDDGYLYISDGGKNVVGDHAVEALARLLGVFFRRDVAKWNAWWKNEAKGALPQSPDSAAALAEYEKWMDEREEAYQEEMRKKLPPGFKPPK